MPLANMRKPARVCTAIQTKKGPSISYKYTSLKYYKPKGRMRGKINMIWASGSNGIGFIVLQQHWKANFNERRNYVLWNRMLSQSERLLKPSERFELISQSQKETRREQRSQKSHKRISQTYIWTPQMQDIAIQRGFKASFSIYLKLQNKSN